MLTGIAQSAKRRATCGSGWRLDQVSPSEGSRVLDPTAGLRAIGSTWVRARELCPALAEVGAAQVSGACIDSTPDTVPVISPVDALPGSFLAAGFSGNGFGPAADHLTSDAPAVNPAPFRLARLVDGSKMEVGAI